MGTTSTIRTIDGTVNRHTLRAQIARWRQNLIDCEIHVDDTRQIVDAAIGDLREAVRAHRLEARSR